MQAFQSPTTSYNEFVKLCNAIGIASHKGQFHLAKVRNIALSIAWGDFPMVTNYQLLRLIPSARKKRPTA